MYEDERELEAEANDAGLCMMQARQDEQIAGTQDAFLGYKPLRPDSRDYMHGYNYEKELQLQDYYNAHGEKNYKEWRD